MALFGEGGGTADEREALMAHVVWCASCRTAIAAVARRDPTPGTTRAVPWQWLLAATVVLALGCWFVMQGRSAISPHDRLVAAAADIARRDSAVASDVVVLSAEELARLVTGTRDAEPMLLHPRSIVLDPRPRFAWRPMGKSFRGVLRLMKADGDEIWREDVVGSAHAYPAEALGLEPGRYVLQLEGQGPSGGVEDRVLFEVASPDVVDRFRRVEGAIDTNCPSTLGPLLRAHSAIRLGLLHEAERALAGMAVSQELAPLVEASRQAVARRLGLRP